MSGSGSRPRRQAAQTAAAPASCRHFGRCGGCSALDVPIAEQLRRKVDRVEALLRPLLGGTRVDCEAPPRPPRHFRTKVLYPVRPGAGGRPALGIYARRSHDLVRIAECRTQDPWLTALGVEAERIFGELRLRPYDETDGSGIVRAFHARLAAGTGEVLIGVVTGPGLFAVGRELAERLLAAAARQPRGGRVRYRAVGVVRSISDRVGNYLLGDRHVPLLGRDFQVDRSGGLEFRIRFGSFYQVHRDANAVLYRPAIALCGDVVGQRVVDGYGGIGTFGLRLARAGAAEVHVVEANPIACDDAEHNAARNGLTGVRVSCAEFATAEFAAEPDLLVVDPPRSGLQDAGVARVVAARPRRLLHVACSVDAAARDLDGLVAAGYRVDAVRLCDMFPHTEHVELLTKLSRPSPRATLAV